MIKNLAADKDIEYEEDGLTFTELIRQEYIGNNCVFSGGMVNGDSIPECDTVYLRFEKDGHDPIIILCRPDEMAAIAWVASGVCWSELMGGIKHG